MELRSSLKHRRLGGRRPRWPRSTTTCTPELINANVKRDATITEDCLGLVQDLAQTWREAALQATAIGA